LFRAQLRRRQFTNRRLCGLVFGPAEGDEGVVQTGEGKADDVEVTAFDARDVAACAALDGIAAGFVVRLAGGKVAGDFFSGERGEMDQRGLHEGEPLGVRKADESDPGDDRVRKARKFL